MNLRSRRSGAVAAVVAVTAIAIAGVPGSATSKAPRQIVYKVPKTIKGDCSVAVEGKIMAWLATVPDGSTVQFGAGRCYGQDGTITLTGRNNLVIDGQGSEFRALTLGGDHRSNWRFLNGRNLTVRNLAVRGSDPQGPTERASNGSTAIRSRGSRE